MLNFYRVLIIGVLLIPQIIFGQCTNASAYGTVTVPTTATTTTISTCSYQTEYSTLNGVQASSNYSCNLSPGGYITIRQGSPTGPVIANGPAPLAWTSTVAGTYYAHWSVDATCATATTCVTSTVTYFPPACSNPVAAGSAVSSVANACAGQAFTLSLSGVISATGLTYQWQSSPDGVTYSDIAAATNATYSATQSAATYYQCIVTCSAGIPATSTPVQVGQNGFQNCYCAVTNAGSACITNVTFNTINNTTPGCPGGTNSTPQAATTSVIIGSPYTFTMTTDAGAITSVWFDWNQNGIYETTEWYQIYTTGTTGTITVNVPSNAVLGTTGMRVRSRLTGNVNGASDACTNMGSGETEDYVITVACPTLTSSNAIDQGICSNSTATFTGTPSFPGSTISWWDAAVGGTQLNVGNSYTTGTLATTTDFYYQVDYPGCPSSPRDTVTAIVTPVSLTLTAINNTCNGGNTGSFALGTVSCGTAPFSYSMDNGVTFGAIPTDLVAGTYFVIVKDATNALSAPIQVIITEPAMPSALTATNVTYYDATLGWTTTGNETSWTVIYGPTGFDPATAGTPLTASTTSILLDNVLTESTTYDFYVFANCGPVADTAGPFTFTTDSGFLASDNDCGPGFIDISSTGTLVDFSADTDFLEDDREALVTAPYSVTFNGVSSTNLTVGVNGGVILGGTATTEIGYVMPATVAAGQVGFYPMIEDMDIPFGGIYTQTIGTAPNRKFIVMWSDVPPFFGTDGFTFEAIFDEATSEVYYVYQDKNSVDFGEDFGGDAEIGVRTSVASVFVNTSINNTAYLTANSCAHYYNALCPNPINATIVNVTPGEVSLDWNAGLYGETNWTVIYGLDGFDPTTGGTTETTTLSELTVPGLTQNTQYDFYIYSECAADNLTSGGLLVNVLTPPICSNPTAFAVDALTDTLDASWNWAPTVGYTANLQYFNVGYVNALPGYTIQTNGEIVNTGSINLYDTIPDANLLAGGVYQVYVQAVCDQVGDTSAWVGPITVVMPLDNDVPCGAETLSLATDYLFNNNGATVDFNETNVAPPATGAQTTDGWANSTLNGTTWFKFVAPASGSVRIDNTLTTYSGQTAVYDAALCSDYSNNFVLLAANDDAIGGTSPASNFTVCGLTPGNEYLIMHDGTGTAGNYSIRVTEIVLEAGTFLPTAQICYGSTIDLTTTITGNDNGGVWSAPIASVNASISGSTFNSNGLADDTFSFQYRVTDGCAYDSIVSTVQVVAPSSAGTDGTITVCKNEPLNLYNGLTGNVDLGGTWYDPSNVAISGSSITAGAFPGSFNYDYIVGNGVCPDDTSNVVVQVLNTCNYLSLDEQVFAGVSVYPNPSTGLIYVESDNNFKLEVTDANGRTVATAQEVKANNTTTIDLNQVQVGVYFIKLSNTDSSKVYRIVVE